MTSGGIAKFSLFVSFLALVVTSTQTWITQMARRDFTIANLNSEIVSRCATFSEKSISILYSTYASGVASGTTTQLAELNALAAGIDLIARSLDEGDKLENADPNYLNEFAEFSVARDVMTENSIESAVRSLTPKFLANCAIGYRGIKAT